MTILHASQHLINIDRVTHIGPGTGGNRSTFHFEGGGIAVTDLTHQEIAELLRDAGAAVTIPISEHRNQVEEPEEQDYFEDRDEPVLNDGSDLANAVPAESETAGEDGIGEAEGEGEG